MSEPRKILGMEILTAPGWPRDQVGIATGGDVRVERDGTTIQMVRRYRIVGLITGLSDRRTPPDSENPEPQPTDPTEREEI